MRILILEDEIPAYEKLLANLESYFSEAFLHDWARSNEKARAFLAHENYDFILSDIQLLDGISFDVFNTVKIDCPIIFCSAHDEYLFEAFRTNGIAYILKPYTKEDIRQALDKFQSFFKTESYQPIHNDTIHLLKSALEQEKTSYKKRFVIKKSNGIQLLNVSDISLIEASGDFCLAMDYKGKKHPISDTLGNIQQMLNPLKFFRINRSQIAHIDYIENIESHFKNRLLIQLTGIKEKVMTSSSTTSDFRKWLEQ
ncbi:LytTR family two component transcriptional regulator [Kordia periserrulae]|uniref:LytTR family two component transcriptional regulator n=1 Tax=Kordia periserrulae TaxID=701523 RepID=A0A2T6C1U6_9FLAO|nr:LytTR family DNA-binding domain-containing protein [Kordia periserrulae]PTX62217.1 LytTR family two component transcriptional regulator [Kordia periserrulae]